ncbi:GNAT family N-acetyltransferase [Motilimonas cestriensis]|uniref:GNAT family N-acetyltransferase n=1 Tax=Motilimonas cestriensis TaxID=2742685 RepID=A0ABS8W6A5_9GAMM|nr:GNAT family N-acetyltransferase [Motilimonas cestriensis]MCE2594517.1 GNAT family N-acetyltransferase [Motilimonas cestriensis]
MDIKVVKVDYNHPQQAKDLTDLLNAYALDPMGGGEALSESVATNLTTELAKLPHAFSLICYVDGKPAGLTNAFFAFSTFKAKPLVNIHDIAVKAEYRGLGLSKKLMDKVEEIAREQGCCKVTLEVLEGNTPAKQAYLKAGFAGYELDPEMGSAMFWQKNL